MKTIIIIAISFCAGIVLGIVKEENDWLTGIALIASFVLIGIFIGIQIATPITPSDYEPLILSE